MARILIGNIKGPAGTMRVGTVTTGAAGSEAEVTNTGTESSAVLNFTIPQGATGKTGATGLTGPTGPMPPLINNLTTNQAGAGALDAAQGKVLSDAVDTLNRNTLAGNVRGNENSGTITIDGVAWYYKDIKFSKSFNGWPIISIGYVSNVDAQHGKERCFVTNVSATGFRMIFENASGNAYYNWIASKQFN